MSWPTVTNSSVVAAKSVALNSTAPQVGALLSRNHGRGDDCRLQDDKRAEDCGFSKPISRGRQSDRLFVLKGRAFANSVVDCQRGADEGRGEG